MQLEGGAMDRFLPQSTFTEWLPNLITAIVLALIGYLLWRWAQHDDKGDEGE
jgi:hypothetical protein